MRLTECADKWSYFEGGVIEGFLCINGGVSLYYNMNESAFSVD